MATQSAKEILDKYVETFRTIEITLPNTNEKVNGVEYVFGDNEFGSSLYIEFYTRKYLDGKLCRINRRDWEKI